MMHGTESVRTSSTGGAASRDGAKDAEHDTSMVTITVNNTPFTIHRGHQTVADIKRLAHVPQADELEQQVGRGLTPLPDDGAVTIKGGEVFVSHPRDSASSHGDVPLPNRRSERVTLCGRI